MFSLTNRQQGHGSKQALLSRKKEKSASETCLRALLRRQSFRYITNSRLGVAQHTPGPFRLAALTWEKYIMNVTLECTKLLCINV